MMIHSFDGTCICILNLFLHTLFGPCYLGLTKKLHAIGIRKGNGKILEWTKSITNHLYWSAVTSDGDGALAVEKWRSLLNHVQNKHEGHGERFPKCLHPELSAEETKRNKWLKSGKYMIFF